MSDKPKAPNKSANTRKSHQPIPAIRLDDLIPTKKVLGGRRVTFGARAKSVAKS
jgi:hypothetical protein